MCTGFVDDVGIRILYNVICIFHSTELSKIQTLLVQNTKTFIHFKSSRYVCCVGSSLSSEQNAVAKAALESLNPHLSYEKRKRERKHFANSSSRARAETRKAKVVQFFSTFFFFKLRRERESTVWLSGSKCK